MAVRLKSILVLLEIEGVLICGTAVEKDEKELSDRLDGVIFSVYFQLVWLFFKDQ